MSKISCGYVKRMLGILCDLKFGESNVVSHPQKHELMQARRRKHLVCFFAISFFVFMFVSNLIVYFTKYGFFNDLLKYHVTPNHLFLVVLYLKTPVNFAEFLRTHFLQNTSARLLLFVLCED